MSIDFSVTRTVPRDAKAVGIGVFTEGAVGRALGIDRRRVECSGLRGQAGSGVRPRGRHRSDARRARSRREGRDDSVRRAQVRGCVRARVGRLGSLATGIVETAGVDPKSGAQAVVEGATLGAYSFGRFKSEAPKKGMQSFTLIAPESAAKATQAGVDRGDAIAQAVAMARDLVNTPGGSLNARDMADLASKIAAEQGLTVEILDEDDMERDGLGGMLGVNRGSTEPPRLIKLTYTPRNPVGSVALVGKGIMFDSGGLSLKSGEGMMSMKIDMSGAAAVLATMWRAQDRRSRG